MTENDSKKRSKFWLICLLLSLILIGSGTFLLLQDGGGNGARNSLINNKKKSDITVESKTIEKYDVAYDNIWINKAIGITYNVPSELGIASFYGSASFPYMHGNSFKYGDDYIIFVDKSLEGHNNLETLASDIISEKKSDKYKEVYNFGPSYIRTFSNKKISKVKIGNFDTVYFESEELENSNKDIKIQLIGYSFLYNKEYISVYGGLTSSKEKDNELLKKRLQYIINSIKPYNGESLSELKGNAKSYYDNGFTLYFCSGSETDKDCSKENFTMNFLSSHTLNGVLRSHVRYPLVKLDPNKVNWNGKYDGILDATINQKIVNGYPTYYTESFYWLNYVKDKYGKWKNDRKFEKLKEETITINDVKFKKYIIRPIYPSGKKGYIVSVYTFMHDSKPYVFSYILDKSVYDNMGGKDKLTDEQIKILTAQTEAVSDSYILTFRTFKGEDYSTYVKLF